MDDDEKTLLRKRTDFVQLMLLSTWNFFSGRGQYIDGGISERDTKGVWEECIIVLGSVEDLKTRLFGEIYHVINPLELTW